MASHVFMGIVFPVDQSRLGQFAAIRVCRIACRAGWGSASVGGTGLALAGGRHPFTMARSSSGQVLNSPALGRYGVGGLSYGIYFSLKYQLADHNSDLDALVERLGAASCDDTLVGVGQPGRLALEFSREADSAEEAVRTALADVKSAIPTARLIEASPDLVGLTDVADIVGVSRQAMRKLMVAHRGAFPMPVHEGSASIWHLAEVLDWLRARGGYQIDTGILEIAQVALEVNITKEVIRHPMSRRDNMELLTA